MVRANAKLREYAKLNGVCLWQVADVMKISDCELSKKLRHPLPPKVRAKVIDIIDALAAEQRKEEECNV